MRAPSGVLRGILLMCAGVSVFPFMNVAVKLLAVRLPGGADHLGAFHRAPDRHAGLFLPQYRWGLFAYATARWCSSAARR